jgi:hypothetical protein
VITLPKLVWATALFSIFASMLYELTGSTGIAFLGSYHLEVAEPILTVGVAAFLISFPLSPRLSFSLIGGLASVLAAVYGVAIARGLATNPSTAINAARVTSVLAIWLMIGIRLRARDYDITPIMRLITIASLFVSVLIFFRSALGSEFAYFGVYGAATDIFDGGRPASSTGALLIGMSLIFWISGVRVARSQIANVFMPAVLILALLLTKQATATVASLVGISIAVLFHPKVVRSVGMPVIPLAVGVAPVGIIFLDSLLSALPGGVTGDTARRSGNLVWRQEIWAQYIDGFKDNSLLNQAIGLPAGMHETIVLHPGNESIYWEGSLHSAYFGTMQNAGVIGLAAFVALLAGVLFACALRAVSGGGIGTRNPAIGAAIIGLLSTFSYSYELRAENALMLVLGMVLARNRQPTQSQEGQLIDDQVIEGEGQISIGDRARQARVARAGISK